MKIVVLDGYTLNPGDLSWDALRALGDCQIHDRSSKSEVAARAAGAGILVTNKIELNGQLIRSLADLEYIGVSATGTNIVDLEAARARNIPVTNVPAYGTNSVAQATMALLLELAGHVGHHARTVSEGRWSSSLDWSYWDRPLIELNGLTMGIVGLGRIGRAVASLSAAFGMNVLAATGTEKATVSGIRFVPLETLLRESDVVSLHCPLTDRSRYIINADSLALMKPGAFLLNTSRGPLVDEPALAAALNSGRIAGAGLDVLSTEPPSPDNPLLTAKNCLITPHLAWATHAARSRLMTVVTENIRAFLSGKPQNVVNLSRS
jgi:glycerate dehydrogenase